MAAARGELLGGRWKVKEGSGCMYEFEMILTGLLGKI
jgi:hypothetical protein